MNLNTKTHLATSHNHAVRTLAADACPRLVVVSTFVLWQFARWFCADNTAVKQSDVLGASSSNDWNRLSYVTYRSQPMTIKADHYYPASRGRDVVVILYAQLGRRSFNDWHSLLVQKADEGHITYILRHYVTAVRIPDILFWYSLQ